MPETAANPVLESLITHRDGFLNSIARLEAMEPEEVAKRGNTIAFEKAQVEALNQRIDKIQNVSKTPAK